MRPALRSFSLCLAALASPLAAAQVLLDGCDDVIAATTCERATNSTLTVWVNAPDRNDIELTLDGQPVAAAHAHAVDGGHRLTLSLPRLTGVLTVGTPDARHTVHLKKRPPSAHWDSAVAAYAQKDYAATQAAVEALLSQPDAPLRPLALRLAARVALREGRPKQAHALLREALTAAERSERQLTAVLCAAALEFSLRNTLDDFAASRAVLARVENDASMFALTRYYHAYHSAQLARATGRIRAQKRQMRTAASIAQRMGWPQRDLRAATSLALIEQRLGRPQQAFASLQALSEQLPTNLGGYDHAVFLNNLNWAALLAHESGHVAEYSMLPLTQAQTLADAHAPKTEQINARLNLVLAHLHNNDIDAAQHWLQQARTLTDAPPANLAHWAINLEARMAARSGDRDKALALYADLATAGRALSLPATAWRAQIGRARVLAGAGQRAQAIAAHALAEAELDATLLRIPLTDGRESLISAQRYAMREHLDLLLDAGRTHDALALIQREQRRALYLAHVAARVDAMDTQQRADWDRLMYDYRQARAQLARAVADGWALSAEDLAKLKRSAEREDARLRALLDRGIDILNTAPTTAQDPAPTPLERPTFAAWRGRANWHVLVADAGRVDHVTAACDAGANVPTVECILAAASALLANISSIDLLIDHDLAAIDWHAVTLRDAPLIDQLTVRYRSGLAATDDAHPTPGLAVLVADPTGNLAAARTEVADVSAKLSSRAQWQQQVLRGSGAHSAAVIGAIEQSALFHYAGHAEFGRASGWDSALLLADDTTLGIGDILTLKAAPEVVVLSGCETALRPDIVAPTMGLANAFLASGARAVIATSRSVDDRTARTVMDLFYERWLAGNAIDDALRMAQVDVRTTQPELDWSAFRLMTP